MPLSDLWFHAYQYRPSPPPRLPGLTEEQHAAAEAIRKAMAEADIARIREQHDNEE